MNDRFEPNVAIPLGAVSPDHWEGQPGEHPPDGFVVSRNSDGSAASFYVEISWNWSPYSANGRASMLHFRFWIGDLTPIHEPLLREMRWLMFLAIWKRQGATLSYQTIYHYLKLSRDIARFCLSNSYTINSVLSNWTRMSEFVGQAGDGATAKHTGALLSLLAKLGPLEVGFQVLGDDACKKLRILDAKYRERIKQCPPIPTRIYSHIIETLRKDLSQFDLVVDRYFDLVRECVRDPMCGRTRHHQQYVEARRVGISNWEVFPTFRDMLTNSDLENYFEARNIPRQIKGLSSGINMVQIEARLAIHTFSGMRDEEVASLPYDCVETIVSNGKTHYVIKGFTTKLNNGKRKQARWVTSREGYHAILIAKKIADLIFEIAHEKVSINISDKDNFPLFVSTVYLGLAGRASPKATKALMPAKLDLGSFPRLRHKLQLPIVEDDLRELEQIDPHRAWRSERQFQIGKPWILKTHQLRRSLALYAQRSGLVSLPSLRRQLQHITEEMARYYARGSAFAKSFIGDDKEHFGVEWQETQPISGALSYILNVLLSDDVLIGGHANWVDIRRRDKEGTVIVDREKTMLRFKKAELAYRETSLGGCTNVENCDQIALKWLDVECLGGCRNLVARLSKVERVVIAQARLVESLDPSSLEYRNEKSDLDVLVAARDKARQHSSEGKWHSNQ